VSETARDLVTLLYGHATAHALKDLPSISFCSRARKSFPYGETRTSVKMLENFYGHTRNRTMASELINCAQRSEGNCLGSSRSISRNDSDRHILLAEDSCVGMFPNDLEGETYFNSWTVE
jgi:hypothetical protein